MITEAAAIGVQTYHSQTRITESTSQMGGEDIVHLECLGVQIELAEIRAVDMGTPTKTSRIPDVVRDPGGTRHNVMYVVWTGGF